MRIGIDLGGTKLAAVLIDPQGAERARTRAGTPRDYAGTLDAVAAAVTVLRAEGAAVLRAEGAAVLRADGAAGGVPERVGLCLPGIVDPAEGMVRLAANLPWLEGRPLAEDLAGRLGCPVAVANDAVCFALSEATDGAAAGAPVVFGIVLGTGVGGGVVVDGRPWPGINALAGEWGHAPLPWREAEDGPPVACGCGRLGCVETVLCGAGLARLHAWRTGEALEPPEIAARAAAGDAAARGTLDRHADALARALAGLVLPVLDPAAVVVGGGLSALPGLCEAVAARWGRYALVARPRTRLVPARFGGDSGMRGAARL